MLSDRLHQLIEAVERLEEQQANIEELQRENARLRRECDNLRATLWDMGIQYPDLFNPSQYQVSVLRAAVAEAGL